MIANDKLGQLRENFQSPLPRNYYDAFENIDSDSNQESMVMKNESKKIIGTLQLSFMQYLTYQGGIRALIEAVCIHENHCGKGFWQLVIDWAILH